MECLLTETAGIYNVSYVKNHTHNSELAHITLLPEERANSATKIASGISFERILDDVRESLYQEIQSFSKKCSKCHLRCNICNHCIHNFICTCIDNTVQWNMCKHIHLLCRSKHNLLVDSNTVNQNDTFVECPKLEEKIISELTRETLPKQENLNEFRENLKQSFKEMVDVADADQLQYIKTEMKSLKSTVDILKNSTVFLQNNDQNREEHLKREPSNKQMEPQRRLFSTKKKAQKKTETIVKPSLEEKNHISLNMLLNPTNKD